MHRTEAIRRLGVTAAAVAIAGLIAACGSTDDATSGDAHVGHGTTSTSAPTSVAPETNSADVEFATMMIPHHAQAVEMADLVPSRTQNAWLIAFAEQVKNAQQPEIDQMSEALRSWGQPVPADDDAHAHHEMDGMMTPEQMTALEGLSGAEFDREWITMMIAHHEGAVTMAKTELAQGENPEMRDLAQQIIDAQEAEIAELREHLD